MKSELDDQFPPNEEMTSDSQNTYHNIIKSLDNVIDTIERILVRKKANSKQDHLFDDKMTETTKTTIDPLIACKSKILNPPVSKSLLNKIDILSSVLHDNDQPIAPMRKHREKFNTVIIRGIEKNSRALFEVRKQLLKLDDAEIPICCDNHAAYMIGQCIDENENSTLIRNENVGYLNSLMNQNNFQSSTTANDLNLSNDGNGTNIRKAKLMHNYSNNVKDKINYFNQLNSSSLNDSNLRLTEDDLAKLGIEANDAKKLYLNINCKKFLNKMKRSIIKPTNYQAFCEVCDKFQQLSKTARPGKTF